MHSHASQSELPAWSEAQKKVVGDFLRNLFLNNPSNPFGISYDITVNMNHEIGNDEKVVFRQTLIGRKSKLPYRYHYDAYDLKSSFDNGSFSEVRLVKYTITINTKNDDVKFSNKKRVGKWTSCLTTSELYKIIEEYNFARLNSKLGCTFPSFIKRENYYCGVMRMNYIPDKNLSAEEGESGFFDEVKSSAPLQRAYLLVELIWSYIFNLQQNKFVHRDLKPANIRFQSTPPVFTIIDFNVSCWTDNNDDEILGSKLYSAPERFQFYLYRGLRLDLGLKDGERIPKWISGPQTIHSDVYHLGWMCARILGADDCSAQTVTDAILWSHYCMQRMSNLFRDCHFEKGHEKKLSKDIK